MFQGSFKEVSRTLSRCLKKSCMLHGAHRSFPSRRRACFFILFYFFPQGFVIDHFCYELSNGIIEKYLTERKTQHAGTYKVALQLKISISLLSCEIWTEILPKYYKEVILYLNFFVYY